MYRCVIFDLDGTLLNTLDDLADACNHALSKQGLPLHETEKYRYFVGNGIPKLIERILPEDKREELHEKTYRLFCDYYDIHKNDKTRPYEGITELLSKLKEQGIKTAVVTNKGHSFAEELINDIFGSLIDKIYGSVEGLPKKPDPYFVNKAVDYFGSNPSEVLYVGDSGVDMLTGKNAGLETCGVLWGFRDREELLENGADYLVTTAEELYHIIENNC